MRMTLKLFFILCAMLSALSVSAQDEPLSLPKSLDWSSDGTKIATGHRDGYVAIWDASTGEQHFLFQVMNPDLPEQPLETIWRIRWSPDNRYLAISDLREVPFSIIVILDATTGERIAYMETQGLFTDIEWSPDGQFLASSVSRFDPLVIWNPLTATEVYRISAPELSGVSSLSWNIDGTRLTIGGAIDGNVYIWDITTGLKILALTGHTEQSNSVEWNPRINQIASDSRGDRSIKTWDSTTGQIIHSVSVEELPQEISWSPVSPLLAVGARGNMLILDATTGQITETIALSDFTGSEQIAWSPYGGRLAYTRIIPASDQGMTSSSNLNDNGIEMIVPIASIEQLNAIAELCDAPQVDSLDALPDFIAQVEALPEGAIPAACRADLLAVADALR